MSRSLELIATLPNINYKDKIINIMECPYVSEVRYNTGTNGLMPVADTMCILKTLEITYKKKIWIDLKGRQLRIVKWADPLYDVVELNHDIDITYPASIIFRNGSKSEIIRTKQNKVVVDPIPKEAVGAGQAVNILAKDLEINGYLTDKDKDILEICKEMGLNNIMASFVEQASDLTDITDILPDANIICKIESLKGMKFILEHPGLSLMAARDDLFLQLGQNSDIIAAVKEIIESDPNAICASKLFSSLNRKEIPDLADYSDLELMQILGYRRFMLDDTISHRYFNEAITAWGKVLVR